VSQLDYVHSLYIARRRATREVRVGDVGVGGVNPIRVQSMTTTDTRDTAGTVDQVEQLVDVGCEIVRITAPSITDAENLGHIAAELRRRGVSVPLVADIHFTPNAALIAAEHVEKVRINPGNYADKKRFEVREYSDAQYAEELERVGQRFRPLVRKCRERGVAMRIGTNHGSLSDRVMNRFGDTPLGMVESALEFLDVCEDEGYREVVFSMKSSNAQVAVQAYRLLAARLAERAGAEPSYPFHVGVTEAGDGEDGRVKSAIGIGSLLEDGIGDTVRVSLTEHPVREVPVAFALVRRAQARWDADAGREGPKLREPFTADVYSHARRSTEVMDLGGLRVGGDEPVRVEIELPGALADPAPAAARAATAFATLGDLECEGLRVAAGSAGDLAAWSKLRAALHEVGVTQPLALEVPASGIGELPVGLSRVIVRADPASGAAELEAAASAARRGGVALEWCLAPAPDASIATLPGLVDRVLAASSAAGLDSRLFSIDATRATHAARALVSRLAERGFARAAVALRFEAAAEGPDEATTLAAAIDLGAPLCDGIGDWVSLGGFEDPARAVDLAYRILQGARLRTTRTEFISCPSCGRTLFDLEETTARVKERTEHLSGVKIAVMGCIVNGPGEMADADFGYVGSGPGSVNLYVGKEVVARGVSEDVAPDRLVEVIREHGRWREPGAS
jgi:(E)-4-hydroxy-3-methylbut-2-enyl-diphosphate synthase